MHILQRYYLAVVIALLVNASSCYGSDFIDWYESPAGGTPCSGTYGPTITQNSSTLIGAGELLVGEIALGCSGTSSSVTLEIGYINTDAYEIYVVAYSDPSGEPSSLIDSDGPFYNASCGSGPVSCSISASLTFTGDPANVYIGIQAENGGTRLYRESSGSQSGRRLDGSFGTIPGTWDTGSDSETSTYDYGITITFP